MRSLVKYLAYGLLTLLILVLLVPVALYSPLVQKLIVDRTLTILNDNEEHLHYDLKSLQLNFPLEIELWDFCLSRVNEADTLAYVHHLKTSLDEAPLWGKPSYVVHQFEVEQVCAKIDSSLVDGLTLSGSIDTLHVSDVELNFDSLSIQVQNILVSAPHLVVAYLPSDSVPAETPDTTSADSWRIRVGALDINDVHLQYDEWRADSLFLHVAEFAMQDTRVKLDTLSLDLPQSHVGLSSEFDMSYLQDSTQGWAKGLLDIHLSHQDLLHVAGQAMPSLTTYGLDSMVVDAHIAIYLTPDSLYTPQFVVAVSDWVCLQGFVHSLHPFDYRHRESELSLSLVIDSAEALVSAIVDVPENRSYRLPEHLDIEVSATQYQDNYQATMILLQDTLPRLVLNGQFDQHNEVYQLILQLSHLIVTDYMPDLPIDVGDVCLSAQGQHFDVNSSATVFDVQLSIDSLAYCLKDDSTHFDITLNGLDINANLQHDTLQVHSDIHVDLSNVGCFDSLQIDFQNAPDLMNLVVQAGDASVGIEGKCDLNHLIDVVDRVMRELDIQTQQRVFDINKLQKVIPQLTAQIEMKQHNPFIPLLRREGVEVEHLCVSLTNSDSLRLEAGIDTLAYNGTIISHIGAHLQPNEGNYDYLADVQYYDSITSREFNLGVKARLLSDSIMAKGDLYADTMQVLTFDGCLTNRIQADVYLAALPLTVANGFLADDVRLAGTLNGHASLDCDSISLDALEAALWFDSASVWYGGCDMNIGLPHDSIKYRQGQLLMDHIRFTTQNKQPIMLDGSVDLRRSMENPDIDLMVLSDNAVLMDNKRRRNKTQFLCGRLPITTQVAIVGSLNDLKVTGQIAIPAGCDLTYYYEEGEVNHTSQLNNLVEFVPFEMVEDTLQTASSDPLSIEPAPTASASKLDVNFKLKLDPSTQILAYLPTSPDDRVRIQGGGNLKVSMDENGELRLSGGYEVTGGDINFKLPMLPMNKQFGLTSDSWLRWSGIVDQPDLNLIAQEQVKCTINDANAGSRVVKFLVTILIKGTLENMDIVFDCSAPEDASIQSELASLTDEDRSKQALMLLITNSYSGPSASTASAGLTSANAAISSLVNKELESLLTNKLKHTEINVGIDTYDPNGSGVQQTDYSVSVSQKFFNDRMRVTVGGKMSTGEEVQQEESSIINDVSVEWLIKKDASQFVRIFRHTNYESVLEGEVVETGVGYVQKRDAFKFKHLFIRSDKKRRAAREAMLKRLQEEEIQKIRTEAKKTTD